MAEIKQSALVVVAKAPEVGKVKTRLCPPLTFEQAAQLYTGFLLDTITIAGQVAGCDVKVVCPSPADAANLQQILPATVSYVVQAGEGLTAALTEAFSQCLAKGYQKVFCISSDNPTLPVAYLEGAVAALDSAGLVLGPSEDGGYYLIGAKKLYPFLFSEMQWSIDTVLAETLRRAEKAKLAIELLPQWYDLDTGQDLARFFKELTASNTAAPYTRQAIATAGDELFELF